MTHAEALKAFKKVRVEGAKEREHLQAEVLEAENALENCPYLVAKRAVKDTTRNLAVFDRDFREAQEEAARQVRQALPPIVNRIRDELMAERAILGEVNAAYYRPADFEKAKSMIERIGKALIALKNVWELSDPAAEAQRLRDDILGPVTAAPFRPERATKLREDGDTGRMIPIFDGDE